MKFLLLIKKTFVIVTVIALIFCFTGFVTHAAVLPSFGGLELFVIPCTCVAGVLAWHFYAPLYLNTQVPIAGAFVGFWFTALPHYILHPGAYAIGTYTPGAGVCMIGVPPYCYTLPAYGFINPIQTGTSL